MGNSLRNNLAMGVLAEESQKTKRARKKLQEKIDAAEKKMTPQSLEKKSREIANWISRHSGERIAVEKEIALFDKNKNSAKPSEKVKKIREKVAGERN